MQFNLSLSNKREFLSKVDALIAKDPSKQYHVAFSDKQKNRTISANAVYQSWYPQISDALAMTTPEAVRYVKFHFGLPILFSNKDFGQIIHTGLEVKGFFNVEYERQLIYMDKMPVTRLFTTKMHNKLRDDLEYFFGQQGVLLTYEKD